MEKTEKLKQIFSNKWVNIGISLLGIAYSYLLGYFAYITFFYNIEYTNRIKFAIVGAVVSVLVCLLVLFTRKSPITCILGMANMVLFFPTLLLDWGNWPLLIPAAVVTLFGFFGCKMNDTAKTIFGTIFLLLYIIGGIAFYMITNIFQVSTVNTLIQLEASPSGQFRYYMLDVQNKASGKYAVYIQPNRLDEDNGMFRLNTTIKKMVKQVNKPNTLECYWEGENLIINDEIYFTESDYLNGNEYVFDDDRWNHTYFELTYPISETIDSVIEKVKEKLDDFMDSAEDDVSEETVAVITEETEISDSAEITSETTAAE
ncbi:MAG: hypothetical protein IJ446_01300 [Oscillospiraceae bacterium]|nr:hypothetical protein [Oscillospiraceae bacterium]